jgi:hypothetical protein
MASENPAESATQRVSVRQCGKKPKLSFADAGVP